MPGILDKLKKRVEGVGAQLNPFDNGATYNTVLQNKQIAPAPSVIHQIGHDAGRVASFANQNLLQPIIHIGGSPIEAVRLGAADLTNNPAAASAARFRLGNDLSTVRQAGQFPFREAASLGLSAADHLNPGAQTIQASGPASFLLGKEPINSIQRDFGITKQRNGTTAALANAGLGLASLVPVAKVGTAGVIKVARRTNEIGRNEFGAIGKNVNEPKPLGVDLTPPDVLKSQKSGRPSGAPAQPGNPSDIGAPILASPLNPAELPELPLKLRTAEGLNTTAQKGQKQPKTNTSSNTNYTTNLMKIDIPEVKPGDYQKARSNAQLASNPIEYAGGQAARAARKAGLSTSRLAHLVEGTERPKNATEAAAVKRYRQLSDRSHAASQALGGSTPYRANYFRHEWDLSNPEDAARFEALINSRGGAPLDPYAFGGIDRMPRVFDTVAEGEANGFKLKNTNAADEILDYSKSTANALKRQALAKGITEADMNEPLKNRSFDFGNGTTLPVSERGLHEMRAFERSQLPTGALKLYRGTNRKLKQTLLSASEYHPINITKKAAPALALEGHLILAAKGAYGAFRAQIGRNYSDQLQQSALEDGTVEAAARIGTPIKFGTDYSADGKLNLGHAGLGEKTIFEKSMPALHIRMVQGAVSDLKDLNIPLDSPEARQLGTRINEIMGFVNTEVRNLNRGHQKALSDVLLAPQFTRAKWNTIRAILTDKGVARSYAVSAVVGDVLSTAVTMLALGYLAKQKSDNINDLLIRALVHPSVPTPYKDANGNNIELGMPATFTSEALGLIANIKRKADGHLGIDFNPAKLPTNLANYGRARLAIVPSGGLKIATNENYANKPLYDPTVPFGTKIQQAGTVLASGDAPIGLQGFLQTNSVKHLLPQNIQDVITANTPGSNPVIKSIGSSFGLTPRTDKTVGKGKETTQYFSALDKAKQGLNRQEKDALDVFAGSKKNPVSGKYDIKPSYNDSRVKSSLLLQNPKVIDRLISLNQNLKAQGQKTDPLWNLSKDQITKVLQYQAMPPGGPDKKDWYNKNGDWYGPLIDQRNKFFNSLPPGDPNKPKLEIQYPEAPPSVQSLMDEYSNLTDSKAKGEFLDSHPEVIKQWNKQADYTNKLREQLGYTPFKNYPEPTSSLQSFMDKYNSSDKTTRKSIRNADTGNYKKMIAYFDSLDLYNIGKEASVNALQGEPDTTNKELKAISSIAQDIYQNPDGTYSLVPAGWMNGLGSSGFGGSGTKSFKSKKLSSVKLSPPSPLKKPSFKLATKKTSTKKAKTVKLANKKIKNVLKYS